MSGRGAELVDSSLNATDVSFACLMEIIADMGWDPCRLAPGGCSYLSRMVTSLCVGAIYFCVR